VIEEAVDQGFVESVPTWRYHVLPTLFFHEAVAAGKGDRAPAALDEPHVNLLRASKRWRTRRVDELGVRSELLKRSSQALPE